MLFSVTHVSSDTKNPLLDEKQDLSSSSGTNEVRGNPVVDSAKIVFDKTGLVALDKRGIENAAKYVSEKLTEESYSPSTWRTHPLHLCPPDVYAPNDPRTRSVLDWIFLISSLNFSFWSEKEGTPNADRERFGIEWRAAWGSDERRVWTGYWSLVAAINRALEKGIPITDPTFYASFERCPDSLIASTFSPASQCTEGVPLLNERIAVMREVGSILCEHFGGSFQGFLDAFMKRYGGPGQGTALQLVQMVTETFPSFRDEMTFEGRTVYFWKRAQILVAETWAAFYPLEISTSESGIEDVHPFFPQGVHELTMFADYRVPQILHHLGILVYPPELITLLRSKALFLPGSREEVSIRAASILAVEAVRDEIVKIQNSTGQTVGVSSVLIDFYLWDLAKRIERGQESIEGVTTQELLPAHRSRSIWY